MVGGEMNSGNLQKIAAAGSSYVDITRKQFETWLKSTKIPWSLKDDTQGIYQLFLSDYVAIEVSSTLGRSQSSMGYARASMQMRLVSRITGRVLNKKAQGKSHYKRTINWAKNLSEGVKTFKDTYNDSRSFYDAISEITDRDAYKKDLLAKIEGVPQWQENSALAEFHDKLSSGKVLTLKEKAQLETTVSKKPRPVRQAPAPAPQKKEKTPVPPVKPPEKTGPNYEELLARLRKLWVAARALSNDPRDRRDALWTMDFAKSLGEWVKAKKPLRPKQLSKAKEKFESYGV